MTSLSDELHEMDAPATGPTQFIVAEENAGTRLDRYLADRLPDLSRSRIAALIRDGQVVCGLADAARTIKDPSLRVKPDTVIILTVPPPLDPTPKAENIPLTVVHEDDDLIVIDKPVGLVVHPAPGNWQGTLVNALIHHCGASLSGIGGVRRPGIVHRLDRNTSGLLVVAKNDITHAALAAQFADHGRNGPLERAYMAFVWGAPTRQTGTIDKPLGRHKTDRTRQAVRADGRPARTHFKLLENFSTGSTQPHPRTKQRTGPIASLVRCTLESGRTHQIRVHMAAIGCPVIGDEVYGKGFQTKTNRLPEPARQTIIDLPRQALHAALLAFEHPRTGTVMRFESPLPPDLAALLADLRKI
ncbi:MAG: RluA family pseudouridine synthase [Alphaproteobacteria bacterium]